ncbi:MAG: c-type cytochrome [Bryobacteraceae bacterium]
MRTAILLALAAVPLWPQHGRYLNDSKNPAIGNPEAIATGAKLFNASCAGCHGQDGGGGRGPNLVRRSLWHPLSDESIFQVIRKGVPGTDMPPTNIDDEKTWAMVAYLHALTGPASDQKLAGDPDAGKLVYGKSGCSNCHAIRGNGGRGAPDLSNIGARPVAVLRESIVQPGKDLTYLGTEAVSLTLRSGTRIQGIARNRSNYSLQVIDSKGDLQLIRMADVKELEISETSPMPGDYGARLSKADLQNLISYLAQQSTQRK